MMLQNACIRYDKTLKQKPSTSSRAVYQHELDHYSSVHDKVDDHLDKTFAPDGIDTSSNDIYNVNNTNFKRSPHVKSLIPMTHPGNRNSTRIISKNPGIMDLSTSPTIFTTFLVKISSRI